MNLRKLVFFFSYVTIKYCVTLMLVKGPPPLSPKHLCVFSIDFPLNSYKQYSTIKIDNNNSINKYLRIPDYRVFHVEIQLCLDAALQEQPKDIDEYKCIVVQSVPSIHVLSSSPKRSRKYQHNRKLEFVEEYDPE